MESPKKLVKLVQIFYMNSSCSVGHSTIKFTVKSGVVSAFLSTLAIDWAMNNMTNQQQTGPRGIFFSSLEDIVYVDNIVLPYHTREQVQDNNPKREYVNKLSYLSSITSLHEVQKRAPEHDCVKPDTHLQSYNLYGGPPERLISEYTRAMSSTCSSTTRGI